MAPTRTSYLLSERRALREQHRNNPLLSQRELCIWFEGQYHKPIRQATVSESLSSKFSHLDRQEEVVEGPNISADTKKQRKEHWQELERAVFEWQQRAETDLAITGDVIREQARWFWRRLPQYRGLAEPSFSNGWLTKFSRRYDITSQNRRGEAGSVDDNMISEELAVLVGKIANYSLEDRYNCDETGLMWKQLPSRSYTTTDLHGFKIDKQRITVHFCCNATGSHKLQPWIIGRFDSPRCFRAAGVDVNRLNMKYHSNKKAWMTTKIFIPWLQWFDRQMEGRQVVLLMDSFSAHVAAYEYFKSQGEFGLKHTTVLFLPRNSTSKTQPLDQGIISVWKLNYRRKWLLYMLEEHRKQRDPYKTFNLLKCIRFTIRSWDEVSQSAITGCWRRTGLTPSIDPEISPPLIAPEIQQEVMESMEALRSVEQIREAMSVLQLINPEVERLVEDQSLNIAEQIAEQFDQPSEHESEDEELEILERITAPAALQLLDKLRLHEEQQEDCNNDWIRSLYHYETVLKGRIHQQQRQTQLESFFNTPRALDSLNSM